jgi:CRP/FNR family cyclic AMP-dependent transcriptional regulator
MKDNSMDEKNNQVIHSSFWSNFFKTPASKSELEQTLLAIPVFEKLANKDISLITSILHNRNYVPGEVIFHQGDPGVGVYIIREGLVEIRRVFDGQDFIMAHFTAGDFFGELALVDGEKRSASAIAVTDTRIAVIFKPDLDEFIEKYPRKGIKILQGISKITVARLRNVNEDQVKLRNKLNKMEEQNGTQY